MKRRRAIVSIRPEEEADTLFDPCGLSILDFLKRLGTAYDEAGGPFGKNDEGLAMWIRFRSRTTIN